MSACSKNARCSEQKGQSTVQSTHGGEGGVKRVCVCACVRATEWRERKNGAERDATECAVWDVFALVSDSS